MTSHNENLYRDISSLENDTEMVDSILITNLKALLMTMAVREYCKLGYISNCAS